MVVDINHLIQSKLAPIKYSKAIIEVQKDPIVVRNLREIINVVESWCEEMKSYLPNGNYIDIKKENI